MTRGRLRAIGVGTSRNSTSAELLGKYARELHDEVHRLRIVLANIEHAQFGIGPYVDADMLFRQGCGIMRMATAALAEPDMGPPDLVCTRKATPEAATTASNDHS